MNPTLVHLRVVWPAYGARARCYHLVPVAATTTDPLAVTCGKCRRTRDFKAALAEA